MLKHAIRRALAGLVAVVLGTGLAVSSATLALGATVPDDQCIVRVIHHDAVAEVKHEEFRYSKDIPEHAETFHPEYRYSKTATIYTVEHKQVFYDGSNSTALAWLNANGTEGPTDVWTLSDAVVNGAGVNPLSPGIYYDGPFSNAHQVPLSAYGGPNVSVPYTITGVEWGLTVPPTPFYSSHSVTLYYTGSGNGSVNVSDAIYVATAPGGGWIQFGAVQNVSNNDYSPAKTVYYVTGGTTTDDLSPANWTPDTQATVGPDWTFIDKRWVVDVAAVDAYDENVYGTCPTDPCTSQSSTWYTEYDDVPPTFVPNGLKFAGPNVPAVGYLHPVSGNLMGVIGTSYTISEASGYHAALVYIINRFGTTGYATISIEPYLNGWAPGQTGTFTVTNTTKVWTSKIPTGLGSQSNPATIAQMSVIFPDNELLAQGIHLGTNSAAGQYTVVGGVSGCGSVSWVAPPAVSCFANSVGDDLVLPATLGVLWKVNGGSAVAGPVTIPLSSADVTVQAVPAPGFVFGPGTTSWTFEGTDDGLCQVPTLAELPTNVTHTDQVCAANKVSGGTLTVGQVGGTAFFTGLVDYFLDGSATPMTQQTVTVAPGLHKVTAVAHDPDDTLIGDTSWDVTIVAASAVCGDLTTLALTGLSSPIPGTVLGVLLLTAGLSVVVVQSVRRRSEAAAAASE